MPKLTPMMEQYFDIKKGYKNCLLFFRLGDFYELFFDDALTASKELDITLTGREYGQEERAPMCGVPYHSADGYIAKLVSKGYKVAICEQVEDPKLTKTIVKREVVRVVTPGTITDNNMLNEGANNYILCIYEGKNKVSAAACDVSTGEFVAFSRDKDDEAKSLIDEISRFSPAEIIVNSGFSFIYLLESVLGVKPAIYNDWCFEFNNAYINICNHLNVLNLNGYGLEGKTETVCVAGALLYYLSETQKNSLKHITAIKSLNREKYMVLDIPSRRNLEITENIREREKKGSLLWVLDKKKTPMGARLLRQWLNQPLLDAREIALRQNAAEEFVSLPFFREEMKEYLNTIYDIERIMSKVIYGSANARDLIALKNSLKYFPDIKELLSNKDSELLLNLNSGFDILSDIHSSIEAAIIEEPPFSIREGGYIRRGYNEELDKYYEAKNEGTSWLLNLETAEREESGIKNLKIRYNKIFGYYIEVTNSYLSIVPDYYIRRQTLANCERYTTEKLKEIEDMILGADDKIVELEYRLFEELRKNIANEVNRINTSAAIIAMLDCLQSFAEAADKYGYVKPIVDNGGVIDIKDGRHPVIEQMLSDEFIPNDTYLDCENRLSIITGPNMAGKSTYMRQAAIIVLMAQTGSFVPAKSAKIGIVDRIFTRVGASDDLATGQSTFMVEMTEVANILNNATNKSLLILDEIGRGTSTFDGLSIAWAVMEYIADKSKIGAKTLFATHYHELTELEGQVEGVNNFCMSVSENEGDIVFLRKISKGGAQASYGIHVAKLAGVPVKIIKRSEEILAVLNNADIAKQRVRIGEAEVLYDGSDGSAANEVIINESAEPPESEAVLREILSLDIDSLSPREALNFLYELKNKM